MTTNLMSRHNVKWRAWPNLRTRRLNVEDFNNAFSEYELAMPPDMEFEISEMPKAKRVRMVTLQVKSRERAKLECGPIDVYADTESLNA